MITASHAVDLFNSGRKDLVFGTAGGQFSSQERDLIFINLGNGLFQYRDDLFPRKYEGSKGHTTAIVSADFSGNGFNDLLSVVAVMDDGPKEGYYRSRIHYFSNLGDGRFVDLTSQVTPSVFDSWPEWIRVADFDNDGNLDFLLTSPGCQESPCLGGVIYLNSGDGHFVPQEISMTDYYGTYIDDRLWFDRAQNFRHDQKRSRVDSVDLLVGDLNNNGRIDIFSSGMAYSWASFVNKSSPGKLQFDIIFSGGREIDCSSFVSFFSPNCLDRTFNIFPSLNRKRDYCQKKHHPRLCKDSPRSINPFWHKHQRLKNGVLLDINNNGYLDAIFTKSIASSDRESIDVSFLFNDLNGAFYFKGSLQSEFNFIRQILKGNFFGDNQAQVLFVDHGPDRVPFEGARNKIVTFNRDGAETYQLVLDYVLKDKSFTHGASVGDFIDMGRDQIFKNNVIDFDLLENKKIYRGQDLFYFFQKNDDGSYDLTGGDLFFQSRTSCN